MSTIYLNYETTAQLFSAIAEKHKFINEFVEVDLDEITKVIKSEQQLPAMLYGSFRESFKGEKADNNQSQKRIFFAIVDQHTPKARTVRSKHQIIDDCRDIAIDVISYLRKLSRAGRLIGFSTDSVSDGDMVDDKDDGFFGWEFSIGIDTPIDLSFKPDKWEEE